MKATINAMSSEAFAAYLAGFTDGEGNISFHPNCRHATITLANCVPEVLRAFQERLGYGKLYSQKQKQHWRTKFILRMGNAHDCRAFLLMTRPYLTIKAKDADLALSRFADMQREMDTLDERNRAIAELSASGMRHMDIATKFHISRQLVSRLIKGHTWASEQKRLNSRAGLSKFFAPMADVFRLHGRP